MSSQDSRLGSFKNSIKAAFGGFRLLPVGIWSLGLVSLFMDVSSELIHSLLPIFMVTTLGASMVTVGLLEGVAEAAAAITKVFSGAISDYLGKRKLLAILGYGLAALSKPLFPLASTIGWVFGARFIDRIGKGIRGAPRDALVAEIAPRNLWGAAYGLRQALDSVGAFLGPLLAIIFMFWYSDNIRLVLWVALVPAILSVLFLVFGVKEPEKKPSDKPARNPISKAEIKRLPLLYWLVIGLSTFLTLARFSDAFLVLKANSVGISLGLVPMIMIVMNIIYAVSAYPAGVLSDRVKPRTQLIIGILVLVIADVVLATAKTPLIAYVGVAIWGLHMGLTQGLFSKLVADSSPAELKGTAFGIYNLVSGIALLLASTLAGVLWNFYGVSATFTAGAVLALIALLGLCLYRRK